MITQHTGRRTTDNRYVRIADNAWWDTTGVDIVPAATVDAHMRANPLVGEMVYRYSVERQ